VRKKIGSRSGWEVLGPADCVKAKVEDRYRRHVLVKSPVEADAGRLLADAVASLRKPHGVSLAIDIDAYDLI
jgi:primosomal protein N' (replication factor Y) (superfamily II helicase)